jgi:hypothetical protein
MNSLSNQRVAFCSRPGKRDDLNVRGLVVDRQRESRVGRLHLAWMPGLECDCASVRSREARIEFALTYRCQRRLATRRRRLEWMEARSI